MFDGRESYEAFEYSYEPDTVVVDVDEDDVRQAFVGKWWHRQFHGTINMIACDGTVTFHTQFTPTRPFSLIGPICPNCHTIPELARSEELQRLKYESTWQDDKKGKK